MQNNKIAISIIREGNGYVSLSGDANVRNKDEMVEYEEVVRKITNKYTFGEKVEPLVEFFMKT